YSKGQNTKAMVINFALENTGAEGQAMQSSVAPVFSAGCPTLEGAAYKVTTVPTWTAKRAVVGEAAGNDREGKATVTYAKEGDYNVTLKLENALGSHTMTYPVLKAKKPEAINGVDAEEAVAVYTTESSVVVEFPEAGDYTVAVFNIEGKLAAKRSQNVEAGQAMNVKLNANGVYMVAIEKDGRTLRTVKLIKK
ncbi:MAG: T9SS type A sorting domain-containing protein, partial [Paramuribaculum sp.]|nr:T9SS type A sorting domain-containing protein [Paramuribaculum sp.]